MGRSPRILMIFLDGVGIGKKNGEINPFFSGKMSTLQFLLGNSMLSLRDAHRQTTLASSVPLNATLGIKGLPQSGTGQTALLTGINAPKYIGKHFGPYPYSTLKPVIQKENIFRRLNSMGKKVFYANAFPRRYLDHIAVKKNHVTATVLSWLMAGFELQDSNSLLRGHSLSSDITNERWNKLGFGDVPVLTPQEAGKRLINFTVQYDFVLYEYFYTDHAGHAQSMKQAHEVLTVIDGLLEGIMNCFDETSMLILVTSDHGNLEDLSVKSHTRNPVPFLAVGYKNKKITSVVKDLTQVAPAIVSMFE